MAKRGPKIKQITDEQWRMIEAACKIQCTGEEIAGMLGIDYDTLAARVQDKYSLKFSEYIKRHADGGKASLRRMQWKAAEAGNATMLVWLGKQNLGQTDKTEMRHSGDDENPITVIRKEYVRPSDKNG